MILEQNILAVCDAYCLVSGIGRKRLSTLVFSSGQKIDDVVAGKAINSNVYQRAMNWFSDHWPKNSQKPVALLEFELQVARAKEIAANAYSATDAATETGAGV